MLFASFRLAWEECLWSPLCCLGLQRAVHTVQASFWHRCILEVMSYSNTLFFSLGFVYFKNKIQNWDLELKEKEALYITCSAMVLRLRSLSSLHQRRPLCDLICLCMLEFKAKA